MRQIKAALDACPDAFRLDVYCADFEHLGKRHHEEPDDPSIRFIHVPGYKRNISLRRIVSHLVFCQRLRRALTGRRHDVYFVLVPPSLSLWVARKTAKKNRSSVFVDIVDLWPDALPAGGLKRMVFDALIGWWWRLLRNALYRKCDRVISCSAWFLDQVGVDESKRCVLYHCLPDEVDYSQQRENNREPAVGQPLVIVYLGSMNHVADLDTLVALMSGLKKRIPSKLVLIGQGERRQWLLNTLKESQIAFEDAGAIFDPKEKARILGEAHYGYNGFISQTAVGFSYKAIEYIGAGLPILNSLQGDLTALVERYHAGLNFDASDLDGLLTQLSEMTPDEYNALRRGVKALYADKLDPSVFRKSFSDLLSTCLVASTQ